MKVLYRYEIEYSNSDDPDTRVELKEYEVLFETNCFYFVNDTSKYLFGPKLYNRKIKKNAYNTFAYDTIDQAMKHFKRRTTKRISWYKYWIEQCENALEIIANEELFKGKN